VWDWLRGKLSSGAPRLKRQTIATALGERVWIRGRVVFLSEPITSPVSGRHCVCFTAQTVAHWQAGALPRGPADYSHHAGRIGFRVSDETGQADLAVDHATIFELPALNGQWSFLKPEHASGFLRDPNNPSTGILYREVLLPEGAWVDVRGAAVKVPDPTGLTGSYREPPMRLQLQAGAGFPLVVSLSSKQR
jgi:hypothetical protein